jgi:integrase/recombinase XerD
MLIYNLPYLLLVSNVKSKSVKKEEQQTSNLLLQQEENRYFHFEKMTALVTEGLELFFQNMLRERSSKENALIISEYVIAVKREVNVSTGYTKSIIQTLVDLSRFHSNKKNFKEMFREDLLLYLDSLRRPEAVDSLHKWIGTYNLRKAIILKFFKWLYYPDIESSKRPKPHVVENITQLKRKEQSIYKPTDLWTQEEDLIFLKYCPNKRDRCYHTISRDLSCRPHEILSLRIKDISFKTTGSHQYAEVLVNGKTGSRYIPLISSVPYVKDWLDSHPQKGNSNSFLIPSLSDRNFGRRMTETGIRMIYRRYKLEYFTKLLDNPNMPMEDKQKIKELLKKPWNPYIRRHSALTEKSKILKQSTLLQHSGWSPRSQMHLRYIHYFGNESSESLLEAYGIVTKEQQLSDALKPKQCPNCNEPNKPDSKFCAKCRMVLTYDAYNETLENQKERESEVQLLKQRYDQDMKAMRDEMENKFQQIFAKIDVEKLG